MNDLVRCKHCDQVFDPETFVEHCRAIVRYYAPGDLAALLERVLPQS